MRRRGRYSVVVVSALILVACGQSATNTPAALELTRSPEFVNRVIPGHRPLALISVGAEAGKKVSLEGTINMAGATVTFQPATITKDDVAEVWVDLPQVDSDVPFTVVVTGRLGSTQKQVTIDATAVQGTDDLEATALSIVQVFLTDLAGKVPNLPAKATDLHNGTPVAGLLVVTHYAWFTDQYEIGLAWHIMVAPDDFAELYVRPRNGLAPTHAYRLDSWSTALAGGKFTIKEITPPPEVTR